MQKSDDACPLEAAALCDTRVESLRRSETRWTRSLLGHLEKVCLEPATLSVSCEAFSFFSCSFSSAHVIEIVIHPATVIWSSLTSVA